MSSIVVTGGAGYIGAHVVDRLRERGEHVVVVDDLSAGYADRLAADVPLEQVDLTRHDAPELLARILTVTDASAIVHLAGRKSVEESVARPAWYYAQNIGGLASVVQAAEAADVHRLVFSSSAAVYGDTPDEPIGEDFPAAPVNPYGESKLAGERMLRAAAASSALRATSLRYFNVVGAARPELGDRGSANLIPLLFDRLERGLPPRIFGDDYATGDGTCIRDYIDVVDLADAHLAALRLGGGGDGSAGGSHRVYNVGTGRGASVAEVIAIARRTTGHDVRPVVLPRRAGDPASVVADATRITEELGWRASRSLERSIADAWAARRASVPQAPTGDKAWPAPRASVHTSGTRPIDATGGPVSGGTARVVDESRHDVGGRV